MEGIDYPGGLSLSSRLVHSCVRGSRIYTVGCPQKYTPAFELCLIEDTTAEHNLVFYSHYDTCGTRHDACPTVCEGRR